ncbi:hypothetical protein DYB32_006243 [Aphanomyces invadans]|uniref:GAG-pre-integrase domain-containing protein n=1 Tax=Aphanomyces invadans TaxID=157072 RepID=A0A418ASC4_9STRA|nr:hypothetical protein DYB32_006243 [Aphanomyces invadans]
MEVAPKMEEPQEAEPLFEGPTWSWETRSTRDVLLHGERISVLFNSRHDLEVARLGQFLALNDPNTPPWMTNPFLITQYEVRAFRLVDLNTEIAEEGPHYRPWLSPMAYISFPISVNGLPWADAYQISVRRNRSLVAVIHDRITSNMDVEGSNAAIDIAANSAMALHANGLKHHIVVDSGASAHMTDAAHHLFDTSTCDRRVVVTNDRSTVAKTTGKLNIKTSCGKDITSTDLLLIEGMPMTLLSVPALMKADPDVSVQFKSDTCTLFSDRAKVATAYLSPDQRLYVLDGTCSTDRANVAIIDATTVWHNRIGHLPADALRACAKAGLGVLPGLQTSPRPCMDCPRAKMHVVSAPKMHTRSFGPGECWHADTKGQLRTKSLSRCQY